MNIANCKTTRSLVALAAICASVAACDGREERILASSGGPGGRASIAIVRGDGQTAAPNATLPDTLIVRVTGSTGAPSVNASMTWTVAAGGGFISPFSAATDSLGLARAFWVLGPTPGTNTATAGATGVLGTVTFTATAR